MNLQFLIILGFIILSAIIYVLFLQEKETFDNRKNKVIVCFFGVVPRSIKYTFSSIQNRLLNKLKQYYDVDIFVFNLKVNNLVDNTTLDNNDINIIPYNYLEEYEQANLDKEIDFICNNIKCKFRQNYDKLRVRNGIRQMYSEYRVGSFLEKNQGKYDAAVICGPDYYLANNINLNDFEQSLVNNQVYTSQVNDAQGYTNGFYFGKISRLIPILKRYKELKYYLPTDKDYESVLKRSFEKNNISRNKTNIVFFKVRANKDIHWQGNQRTDFLTKTEKENVLKEYDNLKFNIVN
jgi:hypothetical protein